MKQETLYSPKISTLARVHFGISYPEAAICNYLDWHILNGESTWCKTAKSDIAKELSIGEKTCKRAFQNLQNKQLISKREGRNQYRTTCKWVILTHFNASKEDILTRIEKYEKSKEDILTRFEKIELEENGIFDMEENAMWDILTHYTKSKRVKMSQINIKEKQIRVKMSPKESLTGQNDPDFKPTETTILLTTKEIINSILFKVVSKIGQRNKTLLDYDETLGKLGQQKFQMFLAWLYIRRNIPAKGKTSPSGIEYTQKFKMNKVIEDFEKHTAQEILFVIEISREKNYTDLYFDRLKKQQKNEVSTATNSTSQPDRYDAERYSDYFE